MSLKKLVSRTIAGGIGLVIGLGVSHSYVSDNNMSIAKRPICSYYSCLGSHYFLKEDYGKAAKNFEKALKLDPEAEVFYTGLCISYIEMRDLDKAIEACDKLEDLNQENHEILRARAYWLKGMKILENATEGSDIFYDGIRHIEIAFELNPDLEKKVREHYENKRRD